MIRELTIFIAIFLAILTIAIPRKYFLVPYILAACFVPTDQRVIVMDLDFTVLRILVVAGVLRIFVRGEQRRIKWNKFDQMVFAWVTCGAVVYVLQWMDAKSVINRLGVLFDVIGMYWLFRQKIRSWDDVKFVLTILAFGAVTLAPLVAFEWLTGRDPFIVLGKVTTSVRSEWYRCQAAFPHAIMLGLFWATLVPVFIGLARAEPRKYLYWAATGASIFIICSTASTTPITVLFQVLLLVAAFRYRSYGRLAIYCLVGLAVGLQAVMNHPVWHLVTYMNIIGGSTGWHRYNLIDQAVRHLDQWALLGIRDTSSWGWGLGDVTNQYVLEGVRGGVVTLLLFMLLLIVAVKTVGRYSLCSMSVKQQWLAWCICVSLLGHCLSFVGVSYFGQIMMLLYLNFAIVGFIYGVCGEAVAEEKSLGLIASA